MIRTRFAPSPTGMIHIGNLRTALYSYLIAKHENGKFILRIEDTDQKRSENLYVDKIYDALKSLNLNPDESPLNQVEDYAPYVQSERVKSGLYMKYALQLIEQGDAYYCFCPDCHSDLERYKSEVNYGHNERNENSISYNGHCRNLSQDEVQKNLSENKPFVIRQKMPADQIINYHDEIIGDLSFNSNEFEDQVLIKQDGYPTYNFANVIDDHLMNITHVVRGNEYISSTPKYILLYNAFKWSLPTFIHLPLIFIKDSEGVEQKLSKRFNCASYENLIDDGYLPEAVLNYIVMLGWGVDSEQEIYSIDELVKIFDYHNIKKASKVLFDEDKLDWYNHKYITGMNDDEFIEYCKRYCDYNVDWNKVAILVKDKVKKFSELNYELSILNEPDVFPISWFYEYKKKDYNKDDILKFIEYLYHIINDDMKSIDYENVIREYSKSSGINFGSLMYVYRMMICGRKVIIMSATDVSELIGKNEVIRRLNEIHDYLSKN